MCRLQEFSPLFTFAMLWLHLLRLKYARFSDAMKRGGVKVKGINQISYIHQIIDHITNKNFLCRKIGTGASSQLKGLLQLQAQRERVTFNPRALNERS
jgi:hypothetical protein